MLAILRRLRTWLFGYVPAHGEHARRFGRTLLERIANDGLVGLEDRELIDLVNFLLTSSQLRRPLRGNTRFLENVSSRFVRKPPLSTRQRQAILNILRRAYPHNLATELERFI